MKSYLLDTSVIIDYLRGMQRAVNVLDSVNGELTSSYFCLSELYEGIYRVKEKKQAEKTVQTFFSSLSHVYGLDQRMAEKFGELRARLKKEGNVIEDIDLFIAATCVTYDLVLITYNPRHFQRIKELALYPNE